MRSRKVKIIALGLILVACAIFFFTPAIIADPSKLQEGDVIFRKENSFWGDAAASMAQRDGKFSHVGIVHFDGGKAGVIHIYADVEKKQSIATYEPLEKFLANATAHGIYRLDFSKSDRKKIAEKAYEYYKQKIPFDEYFSYYTLDAMYCSELVWQAVKFVTKEDIAPQKTEVMGKKIIGVDDLFLGGFMKEVPNAKLETMN